MKDLIMFLFMRYGLALGEIHFTMLFIIVCLLILHDFIVNV
jgi:hypothetical protein